MLRHRSIRLRIIVLVIVPVLALIGLYGVVLNLTLGNLLTLRNEAAIRQLIALPVADVQTQVGNERTYALQYLAKPVKANLRLLLAQEQRTNAAVKRFRGAVRTALRSGPVLKERQALIEWQVSLGSMDGLLRTSVISRDISRTDAANSYTLTLEGGDTVLTEAILPVLTGPLGIQATDLLIMAKASQAQGEESDVIRADLIAHSFTPVDITFISQLAIQHKVEWDQTLPELDPNLRGYFRTVLPASATAQITSLEEQVIKGRGGVRAIPLTTWESAETAYQKGFLAALLQGAATVAKEATAQADALVLRLILTAVGGLVAIGTAIAVGLVLGRDLARQLTDLRLSAVELSTERLPGAITRLRAGEEVDIGAEIPQLPAGNDEIGQVRQAFNAAARTAIAAAVDEVNIRRGVNDVFRNLARRNQSLLSRQLQLLDSMERRVHDPEELADLFRVDHLTTRMRRHAEGLLIVAGGSSGRTWRDPVPLVDVMRAAVAEVEDYTRIRVTSRTSAAVAGHVVADIIHLLAELVENAATFSPASTPVRIDGDKVAKGVVIEIEDRGLGMGEAQLAEINSTLADPPLFDLSGSDQLGLFITGQLAKRHDVQVSLRESPYGGVIAVVLVPGALIVDLDEPIDSPTIAGIRQLGGRPVPQLTGPAPLQLAAEPEPGSLEQVAALDAPPAASLAAAASWRTELPAQASPAQPSPVQASPVQASPVQASSPGGWPLPADIGAARDSQARFPALGDLAGRVSEPADAPGRDADDGDSADSDTVTLAAAVPDTAASPIGFYPPSFGKPADTAALPTRQPVNSGLIWNDSGIGRSKEEPSITVPGDLIDLDGLPMRVRQASLAPQLRQQPVAVHADQYVRAPEDPTGPSPDAARNTMAALQHGWERGRSESASADDGSPASPSPQPADDSSAQDTGGSS